MFHTNRNISKTNLSFPGWWVSQTKYGFINILTRRTKHLFLVNSNIHHQRTPLHVTQGCIQTNQAWTKGLWERLYINPEKDMVKHRGLASVSNQPGSGPLFRQESQSPPPAVSAKSYPASSKLLDSRAPQGQADGPDPGHGHLPASQNASLNCIQRVRTDHEVTAIT